MTKLEITKAELERFDAFGIHENNVMMDMVNILGPEVPVHMSMTIANYIMASFIGHFHTKIELGPNNLIPTNIIAFVLAKSGAKKTSSVTKLERTISPGTTIINSRREDRARLLAEELGIQFKGVNPLENALATEAGMIKRLNDFKKEGLGLPSMFVDEIATELATNTDMVPNIKLVAQLFDEGNMKSKPLKDSENQSDEVHGMGMSALFIGSEYGILEDESILDKFNMEFISKLSRRSFFVYPTFDKHKTNATTIDDLLGEIKQRKESEHKLMNKVGQLTYKIAVALINKDNIKIQVSEEADKLYNTYKIYCEELAEDIIEEQINLEQQHRHWKALKLAGVYALFNLHAEIKVEDLLEAIYVAELGKDDLKRFLVKAEREHYEKFADHYLEGQKPLTIHEITKRKWIKRPQEIDDLLKLANSKIGNKGVLKQHGDLYVFEEFVETIGVGCSYKMVSGTKDERKFKVKDGFKFARSDFKDMAKVIANDTAYTNFEFKDGVRGKDNVIGACDYLILDVDDSDMSDTECSDFLADYNHIICRTSNKDNPYKYRVLIPTNVAVDIRNDEWSAFMKGVGEYLGVDIDVLPKAQIFYGYKDREPIIYLDGEDLDVTDIIKEASAPKMVIKKFSNEQLREIYRDRMRVFEWFYNAGDPSDKTAKGNYHNTLFLASRFGAERGVPKDVLKAIIYDIVDYRERDPRPGYMEQLERRIDNYPEYAYEKEEEENGDEYKY